AMTSPATAGEAIRTAVQANAIVNTASPASESAFTASQDCTRASLRNAGGVRSEVGSTPGISHLRGETVSEEEHRHPLLPVLLVDAGAPLVQQGVQTPVQIGEFVLGGPGQGVRAESLEIRARRCTMPSLQAVQLTAHVRALRLAGEQGIGGGVEVRRPGERSPGELPPARAAIPVRRIDLLHDAGLLQHSKMVADASDLRLESARERSDLRRAMQQEPVDDASPKRVRYGRDDLDVFHAGNARTAVALLQEFL